MTPMVYTSTATCGSTRARTISAVFIIDTRTITTLSLVFSFCHTQLHGHVLSRYFYFFHYCTCICSFYFIPAFILPLFPSFSHSRLVAVASSATHLALPCSSTVTLRLMISSTTSATPCRFFLDALTCLASSAGVREVLDTMA